MKPDEQQITKPLSLLFRLLWILLIVLIYFVAGFPFMRLLGKWPAPYWLSVALGIFLIFGLAGKNFRQLVWIIPASALGYFVVWFFEFAIDGPLFSKWLYHHVKWYFQSDWLDKIPVVVFMAVVMFCLSEGKNRFWLSVLYAEFLFLIVLFGGILVGFYLPIEGACGIDGINYDTYGFRLGANFLMATGVSFLIAKTLTAATVFIANCFKKQKS